MGIQILFLYMNMFYDPVSVQVFLYLHFSPRKQNPMRAETLPLVDLPWKWVLRFCQVNQSSGFYSRQLWKKRLCFHWSDKTNLRETVWKKKGERSPKACRFCWLVAQMRALAQHYSDSRIDFRRERAHWKMSAAVSVVCHQRDVKDDRRQEAVCSEMRRLGRLQNWSTFWRLATTPRWMILSILMPSPAARRPRWTAAYHACLSSRDAWGPPACSPHEPLAQQMVDIKGKEQLGGIALSRFGMCPAT